MPISELLWIPLSRVLLRDAGGFQASQGPHLHLRPQSRHLGLPPLPAAPFRVRGPFPASSPGCRGSPTFGIASSPHPWGPTFHSSGSNEDPQNQCPAPSLLGWSIPNGPPKTFPRGNYSSSPAKRAPPRDARRYLELDSRICQLQTLSKKNPLSPLDGVGGAHPPLTCGLGLGAMLPGQGVLQTQRAGV